MLFLHLKHFVGLPVMGQSQELQLANAVPHQHFSVPLESFRPEHTFRSHTAETLITWSTGYRESILRASRMGHEIGEDRCGTVQVHNHHYTSLLGFF